jgi:5-methyltetrahydropteroyltriglutamate--homocysteine methyltransferase
MSPPFRAEHVGSLLRPKSLTTAFRRHAAGEIDDAAFAEIQDQAIRDAVALQQDAGLKVVTDGEFRRGSYWGHFIEPVRGLGVRKAIYTFHDDVGDEQEFIAPHVEGKVSRGRSISVGEFTFLQSITSVTPKITMPSLPTFHFWCGRHGIEKDAYDSPEAFFDDLARVFREEIADLIDQGARYLQMDEVPLAMLCDPQVRERVADEGETPEHLIGLYIDAINKAVGERPDDVTFALHLCRGNFKGKHLSQGGYEPVAERLFNELAVDAFFLEYDTERAGDFAPLRMVPEEKHIVLGLVSSKLPQLEDMSELERRVEEASRYVDIGRLSLSPQCGFASAVSGNPVSEEDEKRKSSPPRNASGAKPEPS